MSEPIVVSARSLSKVYRLYDNRADRVKETFHPLRKQYHKPFFALKNVSFDVRRGETLGIVGKNGSGKSTLLQLLCGITAPTTGSLSVNGRVSALLELGAGFNPDFTGIENVYLNGTILGLKRKELDAKLESILAFADIGDFVHQPVKTYSTGMYVRLAFSVLAHIDPDIFIVDEALAVGDAFFVHRCMQRFHEMQEQGATIIFVSHDASAVKRLCRRAVWLDDGEVRGIGDSSLVVDDYLSALFERSVVHDSRGEEQGAAESAAAAHPPGMNELVLPMPQFDRRTGNQRLEIIGAGIYNQYFEPIAACNSEDLVVIRLTLKNNSVPENFPLVVGYIFRNQLGVDIASTNSKIEGVSVPYIPIGSVATVQIKIKFPRLHPGSYAFCPTAGYIEAPPSVVLSDRLDNALILGVHSNWEMHAPFSFPTEISCEAA